MPIFRPPLNTRTGAKFAVRNSARNPRFDRLSLFACLHKSLVINGFHQIHKLNYKEESVRKSHRVSNAIGREFSIVLVSSEGK